MSLFETLTALEIKDLLKGKKIVRDDDDEDIDESGKKTKTKKAVINKQVGSVPLTAKNTS